MLIEAKLPIPMILVLSFFILSHGFVFSLGDEVPYPSRTDLDRCIENCHRTEEDFPGLFACADRCEQRYGYGKWRAIESGLGTENPEDPKSPRWEIEWCQKRCQSKEQGKTELEKCRQWCEEEAIKKRQEEQEEGEQEQQGEHGGEKKEDIRRKYEVCRELCRKQAPRQRPQCAKRCGRQFKERREGPGGKGLGRHYWASVLGFPGFF